ncbi:DUF6527 family protein [Paracidovorax wautersii]|uniref:DUF6527 family protein n=1 Tax=Paracidovorax wautersii TaxID=1177982 RepID=UPI0011133831|nr:DUF6527 family protein [Paracidovorax wautersii]
MKALPVRLQGGCYVSCAAAEATHLTLNIPGPTGRLTLPVICQGTRDGTGCWTWNGSTSAPTLRPSVLTTEPPGGRRGGFRCHSWINDGSVQFLDDCSHELRGQTLPLNPVEDTSCET